jgi:hypothetical protein
LRDENLVHLDRVIDGAVAGSGLSRRSGEARADDPGQGKAVDLEFLSRYYREHLRFGFGEKEKEGLQVFANLCETWSLLPKRDLAFRVV